MTELKLNDSVGRWVAEHPQATEIFELLKVDYCCGGEQSLEESCWKNALDTLHVYSQLERVIAGIADECIDDWLHASLSDLCYHIEHTHQHN